MKYEEILTYLLGVHGAFFVIAIGAYYKYGDGTDVFEKSLRGVDTALRSLRTKIAGDLQDALVPLFEDSTEPSLVVVPNEYYTERPVNPVKSERFRQVVHDFTDQAGVALADCVLLTKARDRWVRWFALLRWVLWVFLCWEGIASALLALDKLTDGEFGKWLLFSCAGVSAAIIAAILALFCLLQVHHCSILRLRNIYDPP